MLTRRIEGLSLRDAYRADGVFVSRCSPPPFLWTQFRSTTARSAYRTREDFHLPDMAPSRAHWPGRSAHGQALFLIPSRTYPCAERPGHLVVMNSNCSAYGATCLYGILIFSPILRRSPCHSSAPSTTTGQTIRVRDKVREEGLVTVWTPA